MIPLLLGLNSALATSPLAMEWPDIDASHSRAEVDTAGSFWVPSTGTERGFVARADLGLASSTLVYQDPSGEIEAYVREAWGLDLGAGYSLGCLRLSAQLPLLLRSTSDTFPAASGVGDPRLDARVILLAGGEDSLGVALSGGLGLPMGAWTQSQGSRRVSGTVGVVLDGNQGPFWAGGHASTVLRSSAESYGIVQDDRLLLRGGVGLRPWEGGLVSLEASAQTELSAPWSSEGSHPAELLLNTRHRRPGGMTMRAGLGAGVSTGVGTPAWRVVLGLGHQEILEP